MTTVLAETRPKAKILHHCNACGGFIGAGEEYLRQVNVYDGIYVWKSHLLCDYLYWRYYRKHDLWEDEGVEPAEIRDSLVEFFSCFSLGRVHAESH